MLPESDTQLFTSANREAPAMFFANNQYYLWASGCDGWAPTTIHLYTADEPLGRLRKRQISINQTDLISSQIPAI